MSNFYIPQTPEQFNDQALITITTFGLGALDTLIYKTNIDKLVSSESKEENRSTNAQSALGSPVFSNLIFKARQYKDNDLKDVKTFEDDVMLDCVLFDVSQTKTIITTPIQGFNGTIKEFISDGDYTLNIRGVINGSKNGIYPLTQAKNLFEALKSPIELEVTSWYLNELFGITHVVVTDFQYNQVQGNQTAVIYEIQAISDRPIELFLNKR
jgi:hypothetical protein